MLLWPPVAFDNGLMRKGWRERCFLCIAANKGAPVEQKEADDIISEHRRKRRGFCSRYCVR